MAKSIYTHKTVRYKQVVQYSAMSVGLRHVTDSSAEETHEY